MQNLIIYALFLCLSILTLGYNSTYAEELPGQKDYIKAINDNSLLLEEAYNQEERVVQHISSFIYEPGSANDFIYNFTQEWPAFGVKHQLSYTIPYLSLTDGLETGFGDIMLNYRYQLTNEEDYIATAPRLSVILPTGTKSNGLGSGSPGIEFNLPVSKRISNYFVSHLNTGVRYYTNINDELIGFKGSTINYFAGISGILLVSDNFNIMLETLTAFNAIPISNNKVEYENETFIAPGFRAAINLGNLQIVPGFEVPFKISFSNSIIKTNYLFYISFEHPY